MPSDHSLYVLTLTERGVALHKYTSSNPLPTALEELIRDGAAVEEILLEHLPANLVEALRYDALDGQLQVHRPREFLARRYTATDHPGAEPSTEQKGTPEKHQKYLRRYLRELDHAICDLLVDFASPLQLTGDPEICTLYRSLSLYPHLLPIRQPSPSQ